MDVSHCNDSNGSGNSTDSMFNFQARATNAKANLTKTSLSGGAQLRSYSIRLDLVCILFVDYRGHGIPCRA